MHNTSTEYTQMYNKTISWNDNWIVIFICFVGILLLESSTSSSSSFMVAWLQELSSSYSPLLEGSSLEGESLIFSCFHLLMSRASSSSWSLLKVITSFWHKFLEWMNPMILGGHSRWPSPLLHSSLPLQVVLWFERPLWLHGLCVMDLHILQLVS